MKLVITEKNLAAQKIAGLLSVGKPKSDKVYNTPVYRFDYQGEEWVTIGLRGHILAVDFPLKLTYKRSTGWQAVCKDDRVVSVEHMPRELKRPPFDTKRKPFMADGVDLKGWKIPSLPYLVWAPVIKEPSEREIIRALKNLAKKADSCVIATDFDREGELIGSDARAMVQEVAPDLPIARARYSAITKEEITQAFDNLVQLDVNLAAAGETRQHIDLIWGSALTRYLTLARPSGFANVRSAGRVQTPTLALICEREAQRQAFVPQDYWVIKAQLHDDEHIEMQAAHKQGRFTDHDEAQQTFSKVEHASHARVLEIAKRSRKQQPPAPFNTTSLQAAAASIGLSPGRTMRLAETLYMDGLISYPRVDNTVYPSSLSLKGTVATLMKVPQYAPYCQNLLDQPQLHATRGKQQTTDHPPIHPTGAANPDKLRGDEWKLYNLIARRFLATLGEPATIEATKVAFDIEGEPFTASGDVVTYEGFRAIYPYGMKKEEHLPALTQGQLVAVDAITLTQKQTEPPARYSQGKLIQEMERLGLGTKSTRHAIIDRLYQVKYIKNDPIEPSQLGMAVVAALTSFAPHITGAEMTSELEDEMESIAQGSSTQEHAVDHSRQMLAKILDVLIEHTQDLGDAIADAVVADAKVGVCPSCGKDLVVKHSAKTRSSFVGCMGWPECDVTYPLPTGKIEAVDTSCEVCGAPKVKVQPFRAKAYETCINPACPTNAEPDLVVGTCPVCAAQGVSAKLIAQKSTRSGKRFVRCENYETCNVSYPLPQRGKLEATGETCEACGSPMVVVTTARGPWKICINMDCPAKESKGKGSARQTRSKAGSKRTKTASKKK